MNTHAVNTEGVLSAYKDNAAVIEGVEAERFFPDARAASGARSASPRTS